MEVDRFINNGLVTFQPDDGGSLVTINGVSNVQHDPQADFVEFAGGLDRYPSASALAKASPRIIVDTNAAESMATVEIALRGTLVWVLNDAVNGSDPGGGAVRKTVPHAIYGGPVINSRHRKPVTSRFLFRTYTLDGQTNPVITTPV